MTMPEKLKFKNVNTNGTWGLTTQNKGGNNFQVNGGNNKFNVFNAGVKNNINISTHGKTTINIFNNNNNNICKPQTNYGNQGSQLINSPARIFSGGSGNAFQLLPGAGMGCGSGSIFGNGFGGGYMYPNMGCSYGCDNELSGWDKFMMVSNAVGGPGNLLGLAGGLLGGIGSALSGIFGGDSTEGKSEGGFWSNIKSAFGFGGDEKETKTESKKETKIVKSSSSDEIDDSSDGTGSGKSGVTEVKPEAAKASNTPAKSETPAAAKANTQSAASSTNLTTQQKPQQSSLTHLKGDSPATVKYNKAVDAFTGIEKEYQDAKSAYDTALTAQNKSKANLDNHRKELHTTNNLIRKNKSEQTSINSQLANLNDSVKNPNLTDSERTKITNQISDLKKQLKSLQTEEDKLKKQLESIKANIAEEEKTLNGDDGNLKTLSEAYNKKSEEYLQAIDTMDAARTQAAEDFKKEVAEIDRQIEEKTNEFTTKGENESNRILSELKDTKELLK